MKQPPTVPTSTYRLQFSPTFGFTDATAIVPYLAQLEIDTLYASPYFHARPGSNHGYDVINHNALNPEIGTEAEHLAMIELSQQYGIGHLLDFVPNHMGIGNDNPWWKDVLTWGSASPYASYFDIDLQPRSSSMRGRVLLPTLSDLYGAVLEKGELRLVFFAETGEFCIQYFDQIFPLCMKSYTSILKVLTQLSLIEKAAEKTIAYELLASFLENGENRDHADALHAQLREAAKNSLIAEALEKACAVFQVQPDDPTTADRLDALLSMQYYRLMYWRLARDEINYRRFFDVNDLAGLRIENPAVLRDTHQLVFDWISRGLIQGLRIDHIDGLRDPLRYCQTLGQQLLPNGEKPYIVVEKILARYENLTETWNVAGTTGYEFSAMLSGLSIEDRAEERFSRTYRSFSGLERDFRLVTHEAKRLVMLTMLTSELTVLSTMLERIAAMDRNSVDFTFAVLRDALTEVVAAFPVYRTYVIHEAPSEKDLSYIEWAVRSALKRTGAYDEKVFTFIFDVLTLKILSTSDRYDADMVLNFVQKFQQYTSPVMAKSVEDTSFYRYTRLLSLNEVGSDPSRFGVSINEFHRFASDRANKFPHALSATATHDHKRGEDVRTRLNALTEMPDVWNQALSHFQRYASRKKSFVDDAPAPSSNDEYAIYQTLLGTWPCEWLESVPAEVDQRETYVQRIEAYLRKFLREAKFRSSWINPDLAYEKECFDFARRLIDPVRSASFQRIFLKLAQSVARIGMVNSLVQLAIKHTAPGIPDCYQGCEFWDLSLVDPDNRGAVDFTMRQELLNTFADALTEKAPGVVATDLLSHWQDGQIKFFTLWRLLQMRRQYRDVLLSNAYRPLTVSARKARHILAFARQQLIVIAPRLIRRYLTTSNHVQMQEGHVIIPKAAAAYRDIITNELYTVERDRLRLASLFKTLPFAILTPHDQTE